MSDLRWPGPAPWKPLLIALGVSLAALLLAACGGGGDNDKSPGATSPDGGSPAATATPMVSPGVELDLLSRAWAKKTAKVTYDFTSGSDSGTMTLYWRPPDWRMDLSSSDSGDVSMIVAGGASYLCSENSCLSIAGPEAPQVPPLPFLGSFTEPDALSQSIAEDVAGAEIKRSTQSIAGQPTGCYEASSQGNNLQWCFTIDSVLMRFVGSSGAAGAGDFRLEATDLIRQLSDADFQPPFPVTTLPGQP
ncbi:MAG: hypothetical protein HYY03_08940 [Chloroflexi bacterium]|nr:hypothetical protein [Chloroflexota bacterium]